MNLRRKSRPIAARTRHETGTGVVAKTVMIVEDNELNMKLFNDLLRANGYGTLPMRNGYEALDALKEHRPDLIIMDIQLPEISGLEVTKRIKQDEDALTAIPGHRGHGLRHEGRRGAHPAGRMRGLSLQADLGRELHRRP